MADFLVLGDVIDKWTNRSHDSTLRVANVSGDDRYSVPCFYEGDLSSKNPFDAGNKSREAVEMHIRRKFDGSYGI